MHPDILSTFSTELLQSSDWEGRLNLGDWLGEQILCLPIPMMRGDIVSRLIRSYAVHQSPVQEIGAIGFLRSAGQLYRCYILQS
jgi:hypothetical protein